MNGHLSCCQSPFIWDVPLAPPLPLPPQILNMPPTDALKPHIDHSVTVLQVIPINLLGQHLHPQQQRR